MERDDYTCQNCGHEADPELKNYEREIALHVDHIEPVAQSGIMWDKDNLVTLCEDCHREKSGPTTITPYSVRKHGYRRSPTTTR